MRLTKLFTKTGRSTNDEIRAVSHALLIKAGFIHQEMAGVYTLLPLGVRVLNKINNLVRREMDIIGGQEVLMPILQPKDNWLKTGRWKNFDVLFKLKSNHSKTEYALGPTHEEIAIPLVKSFLSSYKSLPFAIYQIQTKFRDEKRAKSGIIRGREFGMKDMYSFHENQEDLHLFYNEVKDSYLKIFKECGIEAKVTKASGGDFSDKHSHEFMAISEAGEDLILACKRCSYAENSEISNLKEGDSCPECKNEISAYKSIEIGNIFDLSDKFSKDFNLEYIDKDGHKKMPVSGCYGLGTTRLIGSIVENSHDEAGIIWPKSIAPFEIHLISLDGAEKESEKIYQELISREVEVLYDDRQDKGAGEKFNDADLIGIPLRVVVSKKTIDKDSLEVKERSSKKEKIVPIKDFLERYE